MQTPTASKTPLWLLACMAFGLLSQSHALSTGCENPGGKTTLGDSPSFGDLLAWKTCDSLSGRESRAVQETPVPGAPGYWQSELLSWSHRPGPSLSRPKALGAALGSLPPLPGKVAQDAGEAVYRRGDTASAGLLWLYASARDSALRPFAQYRILQSLRSPTSEHPKGQSDFERRLPPEAKSRLGIWMRDWPWHNRFSWMALEQALWALPHPALAFDALEKQGPNQDPLQSKQAWLTAAQKLKDFGEFKLALQALQKMDPGTDPVLRAKALELRLFCTLALGRYREAGDVSEVASASISTLLEAGRFSVQARYWAIDAALNDGRFDAAQAWLHPSWPASEKEKAELLAARLAMGRGDFGQAETLLTRLKSAPRSRLSNGSILYAQGWLAAWKGKALKADSLFSLASAYVDMPETQNALELQRLALLDTGISFTQLVTCRPDAPLALSRKLEILKNFSRLSPLWPESQWQLAEFSLGLGDTITAKDIYQKLTTAGSPVRRIMARARLLFLSESENPTQAIAGYEDLLVGSQQGVPAEFARERLQLLGP